jgi:hypothetical protein
MHDFIYKLAREMLMSWISNFFANLFNRKPKDNTDWDSLNYGKPSAANDELRKNNEV